MDAQQRKRSACNHTATHLMHQALRSVLGTHVEQKGSMVHSGMFRFDFSHFAKVTAEELLEVEQFVNARIREHSLWKKTEIFPIRKQLNNGPWRFLRKIRRYRSNHSFWTIHGIVWRNSCL